MEAKAGGGSSLNRLERVTTPASEDTRNTARVDCSSRRGGDRISESATRGERRNRKVYKTRALCTNEGQHVGEMMLGKLPMAHVSWLDAKATRLAVPASSGGGTR